MTVTYTHEVADCKGLGCFWKLLFRWRGSIYKLIWPDLLCYTVLYYGFSFLYRFGLDPPGRLQFERVSLYCQYFTELIPLSFVLGFYVSIVVQRWWAQWEALPWPDTLALFVSTSIPGNHDRGRLMRRTILRYANLAFVLTFAMVSPCVKKRFPTLDHLVEAGLMTSNERKIYSAMREKTSHPIYWMPLAWSGALITRARKENMIKDDFAVKTLIDEITRVRGLCGSILGYDWISIPLVYTQVVTLAVYTFFLSTLMGRQFLDPSKGYANNTVDFYIPVFTYLQFFFYMGWLKVAESLVNPFGEDDDDFEINWLVDRNLQVSYLIVDEMHNEHPELIQDMYWDEVVPQELPYTVASQEFKPVETHYGSTANMEVSPQEMELMPVLEEVEEDDHHPGNLRRTNSKISNESFQPISTMINFLSSRLRPSNPSSLERSSLAGSVSSMPKVDSSLNPDDQTSQHLTFSVRSAENSDEAKHSNHLEADGSLPAVGFSGPSSAASSSAAINSHPFAADHGPPSPQPPSSPGGLPQRPSTTSLSKFKQSLRAKASTKRKHSVRPSSQVVDGAVRLRIRGSDSEDDGSSSQQASKALSSPNIPESHVADGGDSNPSSRPISYADEGANADSVSPKRWSMDSHSSVGSSKEHGKPVGPDVHPRRSSDTTAILIPHPTSHYASFPKRRGANLAHLQIPGDPPTQKHQPLSAAAALKVPQHQDSYASDSSDAGTPSSVRRLTGSNNSLSVKSPQKDRPPSPFRSTSIYKPLTPLQHRTPRVPQRGIGQFLNSTPSVTATTVGENEGRQTSPPRSPDHHLPPGPFDEGFYTRAAAGEDEEEDEDDNDGSPAPLLPSVPPPTDSSLRPGMFFSAQSPLVSSSSPRSYDRLGPSSETVAPPSYELCLQSATPQQQIQHQQQQLQPLQQQVQPQQQQVQPQQQQVEPQQQQVEPQQQQVQPQQQQVQPQQQQVQPQLQQQQQLQQQHQHYQQPPPDYQQYDQQVLQQPQQYPQQQLLFQQQQQQHQQQQQMQQQQQINQQQPQPPPLQPPPPLQLQQSPPQTSPQHQPPPLTSPQHPSPPLTSPQPLAPATPTLLHIDETPSPSVSQDAPEEFV